MRTNIALLLSLLLLFSNGLSLDGIDIRDDLVDAAKEKEASESDDIDIYLRPNHAGNFRAHRVRNKLSLRLPSGLGDRLGHFLSAAIKKSFGFSHQELYRFQEVYRL